MNENHKKRPPVAKPEAKSKLTDHSHILLSPSIATPESFAPPASVVKRDRKWFAKNKKRNLLVRDPRPGEPWPPEPELFFTEASVIVIVSRLNMPGGGRLRRFFAATPEQHGFSEIELAAFLKSRDVAPMDLEMWT